VSAGPVAPLLTAGRALTEPFRPLVTSCRPSGTDPPAPAGCQLSTRAARTAATHTRKSIRTYLSEAPSVVAALRAHRVAPLLASETLLRPGLFGAKFRAPRSPAAHPRLPRQRSIGRLPTRPAPFEREPKMRATRLLLPTSFDRAPSSRAFSMKSFIEDPGLSRGQDRFGGATHVCGGRFLSVVHTSSVPLTLLAASVAARLGRRHPAARESERSALRPEAPCIGGDPLLADLRRRHERYVTALCVDSRRPLPAPYRRCLSASPAASGWIRGHGAEPPSVGEVTRRRFFGSGAAFRLLQLTRPVGAPIRAVDPSPVRVVVLAHGTRAVCRVIRPLARPARPPRPAFWAVHEARQRGTVPLRGLRAVRPEAKDPRVCGEPSSFLLTSTPLSPTSRHAGLECLRRALASRRSAFPPCPAKGTVFPQTEGAFHRTFHAPRGGFPR